MNTALEQMLKVYDPQNLQEQKNAGEEIMQEIVLCGLSRADFFRKAAFCGGTALRIFYGLDRFSEDLVFSLVCSEPSFALARYIPTLEKEVRSFGLNVEITEKEKAADSHIRSAFLKGNAKEHLLQFFDGGGLAGSVAENDRIKIKIEVDVTPPGYAGFELDISPRMNPGDSWVSERSAEDASYMLSPSVRFGRVPPYHGIC